jgi:hypothetical protein
MLEKVDPEIAGMLMADEQVLLVASQSKTAPGGALSSQNRIYITNNRILFKKPGMFGLKAKIIDVSFDDISTIMLKRGVFSTEIYLKPRSSPHKVELPAVDKKIAIHASMLIQKGMRGELGPLRKKTYAAQKTEGSKRREHVEQAPSSGDPAEKIEKLAAMKGQGIISDQEFQVLKEELMYSIKPEVSKETMPVAAQPKHDPKAPTCRYCNASVPESSKFCPQCGKDLQAESNIWKMCPSCDTLTTSDAVFCVTCKTKFPETLS